MRMKKHGVENLVDGRVAARDPIAACRQHHPSFGGRLRGTRDQFAY